MAAPLLRLADRTPAWAAPAGLAGLMASGLAALAMLDPATRARWSPGCPFRMVTGLDCPGCGATRSMYALTQGDMMAALDHNALLVLLLPLLAWAYVAWTRWRLGRRPARPALPARVSMGLAGLMLLFWVVRNLPWWPVAWLGSGAG